MPKPQIISDFRKAVEQEIEYHQIKIDLLRKKLPNTFNTQSYEETLNSQYRKIHVLVCTIFNVPIHFLNVKTRKREYIEAKQTMGFYLRSLMKIKKSGKCVNAFPLQIVADKLNLTNHATIIHSVKSIHNLIETDKEFKEKMQHIVIEIEKFNRKVKDDYRNS